jgi:hypothetical protein
MTEDRYLAYRVVADELWETLPGTLNPMEVEAVRTLAEGLLLCDEDDAFRCSELQSNASLVLAMLAASRRLTQDQVDRMWERIVACGPPVPARRDGDLELSLAARLVPLGGHH